MFIIIEGVDKQGKTSLANYLSDLIKFEIVKFSQPKRPPFEEYMEFLIKRSKPAILDRFYLGENTYGPVKRGGSGLTFLNNKILESTLIAREALTIYVEIPDKYTKINLKKDKENFINFKESQEIKRIYRKEIKRSELNWIKFNYLRDPDYIKIHKIVLDWLYKLNKENILKVRKNRIIGNYYSRTLIVGEESNYKKETSRFKKMMVPFIKGQGSKCLFDSLNLEKISLNEFALTNYNKFHLNKSTLDIELEMPRLKKIVCLGERSFKFVKSLNLKLDVVKLYHPSYVRRFDLPPMDIYAKYLRKEII